MLFSSPHYRAHALPIIVYLTLGITPLADAFAPRVNQVPSNPWGCALCHISAAGGGPRTLFGNDVNQFARAGANMNWESVCELDSDSDGATNGVELGDPECVWRRGEAQLMFASTDPSDPMDTPLPSMGGEEMAGEPMAGEPMAGEPMAGEPMAGEPMAGEPMAGELMAGEPMAGEPMAGEPMAGEPMAGEPMAGEPMAGELMAGEPVAGEPMAGEPVAGEEIAGEEMAGEDSAARCEEACEYIINCSIETCEGYDDSSREFLATLCERECNEQFASVVVTQSCGRVVNMISGQDYEYAQGCEGVEMTPAGEEMTPAGEEIAPAGEEITPAGEEMTSAGEEMTEDQPQARSTDSGCESRYGHRSGQSGVIFWLLSLLICSMYRRRSYTI